MPTKRALGCRNMLKKSLEVRPKPRVNIIKTRDSGRKISIIIYL